MSMFGPLVSTQWLADRLGDQGVKIVDGSCQMPGAQPARLDYEKRHIDGAVFFDLDDIADQDIDLPRMLPTPEQFERQVSALGISDQDTIIVYDNQGCFSAARVWWSFRAMGHDKVAVLNGGLPLWQKENRPVSNKPVTITRISYKSSFNPEFVCSAKTLKTHLHQRDAVILDARSDQRFHGAAPEPRAGLRSGHMPGAANLPYQVLLNDDQTFITSDKVAALLASAGIAPEKEVITTCGSGVTAAILSLALELTGHSNHKLYDGSWTDWGDSRHDAREFPVVARTAK